MNAKAPKSLLLRLVCLLLLLPGLALAQASPRALLSAFMEAQAKINDFSGAVIVAQKGKVIYEQAFGMADREWQTPNTVDSKFEIGSLTKQFTAACILQLAYDGKLRLDDKLNKYFPSFPNGGSVSIRMLLNHTSGLHDYTALPAFARLQSAAVEKDTVLALLATQSLDFPSGTQWRYTNSGYFLLAYIVEKVTGKPFRDYMYDNVLHKIGLRDTDINRRDSVLPLRTRGYVKTPRGWINAEYVSIEGLFGAGSMYSTIGDLYRWENALFGGRVLSPSSLAQMVTAHSGGYGYGLYIDSLQTHQRFWHSGNVPGFTSYDARYPREDVSIAVVSNNSSNSASNGNALAAILFGIPVVLPYVHKEVAIDSVVMKRYVGTYLRSGASTNADTISFKKGKLYMHIVDFGGDFELKPESNTKFYLAVFPDFLQVEFSVDKHGAPVDAHFIQGNVRNHLTKR